MEAYGKLSTRRKLVCNSVTSAGAFAYIYVVHGDLCGQYGNCSAGQRQHRQHKSDDLFKMLHFFLPFILGRTKYTEVLPLRFFEIGLFAFCVELKLY